MIGNETQALFKRVRKMTEAAAACLLPNKTTAFEYGVCRNFKMCIKHFKFNLVSIYCENYRSLTVFCMSCVALIHCNSKPFQMGWLQLNSSTTHIQQQQHQQQQQLIRRKKVARKMSPRWTNQTIFKIKLSSSLLNVSHRHIRNKCWQKSRETHSSNQAVEMKCTVLISAQLMFDVEYVPISVVVFSSLFHIHVISSLRAIPIRRRCYIHLHNAVTVATLHAYYTNKQLHQILSAHSVSIYTFDPVRFCEMKRATRATKSI